MKQKNVKQLWKKRLSMGLSLAMAVTMLPAGSLTAFAEDGDAQDTLLKARSTAGVEGETYTRNQPFIGGVTGTTEDGAGRPYFSAPAFAVKETIDSNSTLGECTILTASNTMLIAAAEGRFDQAKKAGGTDVIAAISKDNGTTWTYSYPLRFPDSEGNAGKNATSINNPALTVASDGTIYCLMNVTPTGVSSLAAEGDGFTYPNVGTGYIDVDGTKRLALTTSTETANQSPDNYVYYVGDFDNTTELAKVLKKSDGEESDYAVDKWYNLYKKNSDGSAYEEIRQKRADASGILHGEGYVQQNVFYAGSELHVYNTSYVVCVTSTDGLSWSAPEILNPYVKKDDGKSLVVSGGKGLTTSKGRLVFPVYRNNDGTAADGTASVIWLDKSTGGDNQWHRSENVPDFESGDGEDAAGTWIGPGEIVELSDGKLRMVFQNDQGLISYADAQRNAQNKFVFSAPVSTGTRSPQGTNPSVISYLKPIDERKGLLISAPVGTDRTDGRIMTFLSTGSGVTGDGDTEAGNAETGGMTRVEGTDVPGGKDYFQNSCIDQFNAGDNIGIVWESGSGSVRFRNLGILDVVKEHYIPHVTVDLNLTIGDVYERSYTVVGSTHMNGVSEKPMSGQDPDESVVSVEFNRGEEIEEEIPALYPHVANNAENDGNLSNAFQSSDSALTEAIDQIIERAEFTITRPDNSKPDEYEVYSSLDRRYYRGPQGGDNTNKGNEFSAAPARVVITKNPEKYTTIAEGLNINQDEFSILLTNGDRMSRMAAFFRKKLRFDKQDNWTGGKSDLDPGFTLLQKLGPDEKLGSEDAKLELIAGYKKVTEITPNEKYLIAYVPKSGDGNLSITMGDSFNQEGVQPIFILYPRNNVILASSNTKLVYGTRTVTRKAQKTLKITAKGSGDARVVVNHIIYNIHCRDLNLEMRKGEKKFFADVSIEDCSVTNDKIAKVESYSQKTPSLFNCERTAKDSLSGYSKIPNTDVNMSGAEFIFTSAGNSGDEIYTIQSALNGKYLLNDSGAKFFGTSPTQHTVKRPDGSLGFEIMRSADDRFIFFYYTKMQYDATADKDFVATANGDTEPLIKRGNFTFELLEKQDYPSDADQIRGYKRVTSITSGKHYLITQVYNDSEIGEGRIVLYPGENIQTWSKLYRDVETPGVLLTAIGNTNDTTTVTIGEDEYTIKITGVCEHKGERYLVGTKDPSCEEEGYTGDVYCADCDEKIADGQKIPAGHDVPVWNVTTEPTFDADGERSGTCSKCKETITKPYTKEEYADKQLNDKVAEARAIREADYTAKSYALLSTALAKFDTVEDTAAAKKALYDEITAAISGLERKTDFDAAKKKVSDKLLLIKAALAKNESEYETAVWQGMQAAVNALKDAEIGIDLAALADEAAINTKLDTLALSVLNSAYDIIKDVSTSTKAEAEEQAKRAKLKSDIKAAVSEARTTIDGGQGNYTDESWQKLTDACSAANLSDSTLEKKTTQELEKLLSDLTAAKEGLTEKTNTDLGSNTETEAAKAAVAKAVQDADAIAGAGQKNYTKETWDAFMAAYTAAKNAPANADAATLNKLAADLANAQKALKTAAAPADTLQKGYTEDIKGIRYEVLDPVKLTVTAKSGLNKKAKSISIPATVTIKGNVICKVVQVSDKAFSGYKKATKITIGANVATIGKQAFANCKKLKKLTLKGKALKTDKNIKPRAFKGATKKKVKVTWPKGIKKSQKKKLIKGFKKAGLKV